MMIEVNNKNYGKMSVLVDDSDYAMLLNFTLHVYKSTSTFYVLCRHRTTKKLALLHRIIIGAKKGNQVDHINHNGLDNRRNNLRGVSKTDNAKNRLLNKNSRTGLRGVFIKRWRRRPEPKYGVKIQVNKKTVFGGYFDDPIQAAKRYNELALIHHGEFANINGIL